MLQRIDLRAGLGSLRGVLPRAAVDIGGAVASVGPLIQDVRDRGAAAVLDAAERFDGRPSDAAMSELESAFGLEPLFV